MCNRIDLDPEGAEIWIRVPPAHPTLHASWTRITVGENEVRFSRDLDAGHEAHATPQLSRLLLDTGLVPLERFAEAARKTGSYPRGEVGEVPQRYHLFFRESSQELFLLQQNLPSPAEEEPAERYDQDGVPWERYIDRYGKGFLLEAGELKVRSGMMTFPLREKLTPISLELLLASGLSTPEIVSAVGGPYVFTPRKRLPRSFR